MSIDKEILYGIILSTMDRNNNWEGLDRDLVTFLLQKIIYRNVVDGCHKRGDEKDFEMVPQQKSLFSSKPGTGLPIGDLTSQLFSNIYLNELDQFVKRDLKCRHYGRYVDDFYLVHEDKYYLLDCVEKIRQFLKERLHLTLHPNKITLQECTMGLNFLGAYICPFRIYASNRTVGYYRYACKCIDRRCRYNANIIYHDNMMKMCSVLNSYLGHLKQFRTGRIRQEGMKNNSIKWFCYTNRRLTKIKPSIYGYYVNNPDYCGVGRQIGDLSPICSPERCKRRTLADSQVRNPAGDTQSGSFALM